MRNQFIYTEIVTTQDEKGKSVTSQRRNSFNVDCIVRAIEMDDGGLFVLLDDLHERYEEVPRYNKGKTKVVGTSRIKNTFQSEIRLSKEDGERFFELTDISKEDE